VRSDTRDDPDVAPLIRLHRPFTFLGLAANSLSPNAAIAAKVSKSR
jgi:hypothetical protein